VYDTHIHSEGRSIDELKAMGQSGIRYANTCAFYPVQPQFSGTLIDLFRKIEEFETHRAKKAGINIFPAIGIHPRCIPPDYGKVLDYMEIDTNCVAFGEIGLEIMNEMEIEVLREQLEIAKKRDIPCIIHTPRSNKSLATSKILEILEKISFPEGLAVVDHAALDTFQDIWRKGYHVGLTVQEGKLSERDVLSILQNYGSERIMINSDSGFSDSDYLSTSKIVKFLLQNDIDRTDVVRIAFKNPESFFRI